MRLCAHLLIAGLVLGGLVGCVASPKGKPLSWLHHFRQNALPAGPDVVEMDVAVVERPVGDRYLNEELWTFADEQVIALERKAVLEDNGFRVGQVGGITPAGLQELLTSKKSCADPRGLHLLAGKPTTLRLGTERPRVCFEVHHEGQVRPYELHSALCTLEVEPSLTPDGRTRLRFTPLVHHGQKTPTYRPAKDRSCWMVHDQRPSERFPQLGWEVDLVPNEYVVVGARFDRPGTLGYESFIGGVEAAAAQQRLLVIRTRRALPPAEPAESAAAVSAQVPRPLAYHAATTARGTAR